MTDNHSVTAQAAQEDIARQAETLASEVRLLAVNLAVMVAKIQRRQKNIRDLEPQFADLIKKANDTAQQVSNVVMAYHNQQKMICALPASSEVIAIRGAYDKIEATLNSVYELSCHIQETLKEATGQNLEGRSAGSKPIRE